MDDRLPLNGPQLNITWFNEHSENRLINEVEDYRVYRMVRKA